MLAPPVPLPPPCAAGLGSDNAALVPFRSVTTDSRLQPVGLLFSESMKACVASVIDSLTKNFPYGGWSYHQIRLFVLMSGLFPPTKNLAAGPRPLGTIGMKARYGAASLRSATWTPPRGLSPHTGAGGPSQVIGK